MAQTRPGWVVKVAAIFEEAHNMASLDFIASRFGVTSEETEKLLGALEREGRVAYDASKNVWRWHP
jgi:DNA-binding IclR family transcriptional regulator